MTEKSSDQEKAPAPAGEAVPKKEKGPGFVDALWKFFSSVHLAVILLLILAAISIIGTVLAQGDSAADNIQLFERFVVKVFDLAGVVDADNPASVDAQHDRIHAAAERLYRFSDRAGFTNLYHAWYFYLLLALFSMNLTVCSIKRWPHTWRVIARNPVLLEERRLKSMANRRTLSLPLSAAEAADRVREAMKKRGYSPKTAEEGGAVGLFAQKGVYSRLGVYSTHLSILIILVGGIVGVTMGLKGYMQITEGTAESRFYDRRAKTTKKFGFQVRCDDFRVEYYPGTRAPKDYYSDLTVIKDGVEVMSKRIEVNSPLVYDDSGSRLSNIPFLGVFVPKIFFYQSSFGETGQGVKALFSITDPASGEVVETSLDTTGRELPGSGMKVRLLQVLPDFDLDANQRPYSRSNQPNNPAALVEATEGEGQPRRTWLFRNFPDVTMNKEFPLDIAFTDYGGIQYTGLQITYDPGTWVIWLGCIVMVIGLYLAFFVSHRRIWARVQAGEKGTVVLLAGSANKNRDAFAEEFDKLGDLLEGHGKEKGKS